VEEATITTIIGDWLDQQTSLDPMTCLGVLDQWQLDLALGDTMVLEGMVSMVEEALDMQVAPMEDFQLDLITITTTITNPTIATTTMATEAML
jgi:hypothetical protein